MRELEAGAIANPDEKRMVGHYWLRDSGARAHAELRADIDETNARIKQIRRRRARRAESRRQTERRFKHVLLIGIGGSALGPQFIADALGTCTRPDRYLLFSITPIPDGFDRVFEQDRRRTSRTRSRS